MLINKEVHMKTKIFASVAVLAMILPATHVMAGATTETTAGRIDATDTLPDAKPGQCFAKVIIPAQYETKQEQVLVKAEAETVQIKPAVFGMTEKTVTIKPAYTSVKAVPAKFREEIEKVEITAASTRWMTNLGKRAAPASPTLLAGAKASGIDVDNAIVGACYKEYYVPASYARTEKDILVKEAFEVINVTGAQFKSGVETIVVKQASEEKIYHPAEYETVEETVEVEPAKTIWKKGDGPVTKIDNSTGEIMCLVEVPAKFETFKTTTLKTPSSIKLVSVGEETKAVKVSMLTTDAVIEKVAQPAEYKKVTMTEKTADAAFSWRAAGEKGSGEFTGSQICLKGEPAQYTNVKKLVIASAATVAEEKVSAVSKSISVSTVTTEAQQVKTVVPAVYGSVEKRTRVASERLEWRSVLCKTNMNEGLNNDIQVALKAKGFYDGPIDGIWGRGTMNGIEAFQKKNGLATGGLTLDALEKLGVM